MFETSTTVPFKAWREVDESETDTSEDEDIETDSSDEEEEPPHPLGFHPSYGRTRFYLDKPRETTKQIRQRLGYLRREQDDFTEDPFLQTERQQSFPPLQSYLDTKTASTTSLLKYSHFSPPEQDDDSIDMVTQLLEAASVVEKQSGRLLQIEAGVGNQLMTLASVANREMDQIRMQMTAQQRSMQDEHSKAADALRMLLKRDEDAAADALRREKSARKKLEAAEEAQRAHEEKEEAEKLRIAQEREQYEEEKKQKTLEKEKKRREAIDAKKKAAADEEAKKMEYATKAKKLVGKLVELRASVAPFETSKAVSKRRLHMKKTVRGKVNTLTLDPRKIQSVASEVASEIQLAREEDERNKQQLQAGNAQVPAEATRGKRYLVDLLSSTAMVRAQAEGFNGPRGDGFPLAAMLALVSTEAKELVPILAAHIYTVCPTAIPTLPHPSKDSSEEALMESLGMIKDKSGEFETFERFLTRTEGIVSLVADIMASTPSTHVLLGGHKGAIEWLDRFLDLLPPPPETLPLNTAPVLDGFLTGAGHMLANKFPDQFKKHLDIILNDTITRLDVGPIGEPRALRLKKVVQGGFNHFKTTLPPKAIPSLYLGSSESTDTALQAGPPQHSSRDMVSTSSGSTSASVANPFGSATGSNQGQGGSSPFGAPGSDFKTSTPFAANTQQSSMGNGPALSPFGGQSSGTGMTAPSDDGMAVTDHSLGNSTPFGTGSTQSTSTSTFATQASNPPPFGAAPTPFGATGTQGNAFGAGNGANPNPSPFGVGASGGNSNSFGSTQATPFGGSSAQASPFGGTATQPSPFGSTNQATTPFGGGTATQASPFGGNATQAATPFGGSTAAQASPFGGNTSQAATPFGGSAATQASPFGGTAQASPFGGPNTQASPFGSTPATPFGGNQQPGPFDNNSQRNQKSKPPCKFFAQGRCQNGANCRFSHETAGSSGFSGGNPKSSGSKPPCKFFAQGRCQNGANCRFSHETTGSSGFSGGNPNSFGSNPRPFGGGGGSNSSPFAGGGASNPFGGPRR